MKTTKTKAVLLRIWAFSLRGVTMGIGSLWNLRSLTKQPLRPSTILKARLQIGSNVGLTQKIDIQKVFVLKPLLLDVSIIKNTLFGLEILYNLQISDPPLKPENFTCISENWESLQCSWDVPYNPVKTTYELYYYEGGHAGR